MWCYVCCCCQTCTSLELQVTFKVCRAFEFLLIMELWADFVSNRFWICVLPLSRGYSMTSHDPLPRSLLMTFSLFWCHAGMSRSRHWSRRSCSAWLKEKEKQPTRPRKGTASLRRGRGQPSWWVTNPLPCFQPGQAEMALLEGICLMSLVWWTEKLGFRLKHSSPDIT